MKLTRRGFLGLSLATGVLAGGGLWLRRFIRPAPLTSSEVNTLESYLDTLIPADDSSGAVELGVTDSLIQKAAVNKRYKKLIQKGCKWLDSEAQRQEGADFAALTEPQREGVMRVAVPMADRRGVVLLALLFVVTGVILIWRRPQSRSGA